jgi:protoporphyrinogen oxidase
MTKVVIIGAGLSGLSSAYHLGKDFPYQIYEKHSRVGGLCRSEKVGKFTFDYGGHLLHFSRPEVKQLVAELLGENIAWHKRRAGVYSRERYLPYPFQANIYGLPPETIQDCLVGWIMAYGQRNFSPPGDLEGWLKYQFGEGFCRHFFFPYNRKLYKVPLSELTSEWAEKFIPCPTVEEVVAGAISPSARTFGYHKEFAYPLKGGIEALVQAFQSHIRPVNLNYELAGINLSQKFLRFQNGEVINYKNLVSTIPLPELISRMEDAPANVKEKAAKLKAVSVYNFNFGYQGDAREGYHWIYFPEEEITFYRVGFPNVFSSSLTPPGTGLVSVETTIWGNIKPENLLEKILIDLQKAGILPKKTKIIMEKCLILNPAYVLYDKFRKENLGLLLGFLQKNGIYSIGRYGRWEYSAMEDAIYQGKEIAEKIRAQI